MSSQEPFAFTLYARENSRAACQSYERLAQLCERHLAKRFTIKLVVLGEEVERRKETLTSAAGPVRTLPAEIASFLSEVKSDPSIFLIVE